MAFLTRKTWYWFIVGFLALLVLAILALRIFVEEPIEVTLSTVTFVAIAPLIPMTIIAFELSYRMPKTLRPASRRLRSFEYNPVKFSFIMGGLVFALFSTAKSIDHLFVITMDFEYVEATEVREPGEPPNPTYLVEPIPTNQLVRMNVIVRTGAPYYFRVCHKRGPIEAAPPSRIALFLMVEGEPQPLEFRYERREDPAPGDRPGCLTREPKLLGDVENRERVCAVVEFRSGGKRHSERTCWDFVRERGEDKIPLTEITAMFG